MGISFQQELNLFQHVSGDHQFKDEHLFYRFQCHCGDQDDGMPTPGAFPGTSRDASAAAQSMKMELWSNAEPAPASPVQQHDSHLERHSMNVARSSPWARADAHAASTPFIRQEASARRPLMIPEISSPPPNNPIPSERLSASGSQREQEPRSPRSPKSTKSSGSALGNLYSDKKTKKKSNPLKSLFGKQKSLG